MVVGVGSGGVWGMEGSTVEHRRLQYRVFSTRTGSTCNDKRVNAIAKQNANIK